MVKSYRGCRWCFTHNNYTEEDEKILQNFDFQYLIYGREVGGATATPHLQGYFELNKKTTLVSIKKQLKLSLHLEACKGSSKSNIKYCSKDKNTFSKGIPKEQGKRTDIHEIYDMVKDNKTNLEIQEEHLSSYCKYYKAVDRLRTNLIQDTNLKTLKESFKGTTLRKWQSEVLKELLAQNNRQILWIYDEEGNKGKTFLAKYLLTHYSAFYVMNGKNADISYSYNYEDIVIFDYSRSQEDFINYSIIEQFKNGLIFSSKYESLTKVKNNIKIICLSNFAPDLSKLSSDRWSVKTL